MKTHADEVNVARSAEATASSFRSCHPPAHVNDGLVSDTSRWLADGRTLILTGFPDDEPEECRRTNCLKNNEWVKQMTDDNILVFEQ